MTRLKGTGQELGRIEVDGLGAFILADDGDGDLFADMFLELENGTRIRFGHSSLQCRQDLGDEAIMDAIDAHNAAAASGDAETVADGGETTTYTVGSMVCDDCHRTWPARKDQTPDRGFNTCPDCHEDD